MNDLIDENYNKEGKKLFELIQEWIDENNSYIYCKANTKDIKYNCR